MSHTITKTVWRTDPKTGARITRIYKIKPGDANYAEELKAEQEFLNPNQKKSEIVVISNANSKL